MILKFFEKPYKSTAFVTNNSLKERFIIIIRNENNRNKKPLIFYNQIYNHMGKLLSGNDILRIGDMSYFGNIAFFLVYL